MIIRHEIMATFSQLLMEETGSPGDLHEELELLNSGLDSLGLAVLIVRLESKLGFDPFTVSEIAIYPRTLGEFISFYEDVSNQLNLGEA